MTAARILAVDYGDRRTGLAATDYTGTIMSPLPVVEATDAAECADAVAELAQDRETQLVVVGLPLTNRDEEGARAQRTRAFIALLEKRCPCPITTMDERFSTDEAHDLLKQAGLKAARRKQLADSTAALIILQRYLSR
ncbi:MAG: Holliday junction resolvase RuvX [Planctomycetota bacterium]|jgi:putative Holliday junction resolvase